MDLKQQLEQEMKEALKARDTFKLNVIRFLLAQIKNKEIDLRKPLSNEDIYKIIQTLVKQRKESISFSEKAGRTDLVEKEKAELSLLEAYLPKSLTEEEIKTIITDVIKELNATQKDFGKVMKTLMPKIAGRADGAKVNELLRKLLV